MFGKWKYLNIWHIQKDKQYKSGLLSNSCHGNSNKQQLKMNMPYKHYHKLYRQSHLGSIQSDIFNNSYFPRLSIQNKELGRLYRKYYQGSEQLRRKHKKLETNRSGKDSNKPYKQLNLDSNLRHTPSRLILRLQYTQCSYCGSWYKVWILSHRIRRLYKYNWNKLKNKNKNFTSTDIILIHYVTRGTCLAVSSIVSTRSTELGALSTGGSSQVIASLTTTAFR